MVDKKPVVPSAQAASSLDNEKMKHRKLTAKRGLFIAICVVTLIVIIGVSLVLGSAGLSFTEAYAAIFAKFFPNLLTVRPLADNVVWNLRLPRILLGLLAGATLAMSGSTTQATLKNPIATPYTLGVSTGASFGASIAIIFGMGFIGGNYLIIGNAFVFSLIPIFVILVLVKHKSVSPETMILCGIALNYIFAACNIILQYFASNSALADSVFWTVGDLSRHAWTQLPFILAVLSVCLAVNLYLSWDLNIMKMGDDTAKSLGVEVNRTRLIVLVAACLSTATVICFTGPIGFICLVAPHVCRAVVGGNERYLIVSSAIFGAILLLGADIIARQVIAPIILPVGAVTAFLGGPMLLYLLIKRKTNR